MIAVILAVTMIAELALYNAASIRFSRDKYTDSEYAQMADYLEEDDEYMSASRLQRMRAVLRLLGQPQSYDEYSLAASVAIADEDYTKAAEMLEECVRLFTGPDEELADLYVKLGCVNALERRWKTALTNFRNAAERDGGNTNAWLMMGEACLRTEDYAGAVEAMRTYGTLKELTPAQYSAVASMELILGRAEDAVESCTTGLSLADDGSRAELLYTRAQAQLLLGHTELAAQDAADSFAAGGSEIETKTLQAASYDAVGRYTDAYPLYLQAIQAGSQDPMLFRQAVECAYLCGDYETMLSLAERGLTLTEALDTQTLTTFYKWIGVGNMENGNLAEADENLGLYIENVSQPEAEIYYLRGLSRMTLGNYDGAIEDFTMGMDSEELKDECLYNRGLCYMGQEHSRYAAEDFEEIIKRDYDPNVVSMVKEFLGIN